MSGNLGHICPRWEVVSGRVLLRCRTKRLQAVAGRSRAARRSSTSRSCAACPARGDDQRLDLFYDPARVGAGGSCPGTTPAGRGECAFRDGKWKEAEVQFKLGLESYDRPMSALRLGDLAARRGDFNAAALMWNRAGTLGPFGRLAAARLCELRGGCMEGKASGLFDGGELKEPMRTELALRAARVDAFAGRHAKVLKRLTDVMDRPAVGGCVTAGHGCSAGGWCPGRWKRPAATAAAQALELYLSLPGRDRRPGGGADGPGGGGAGGEAWARRCSAATCSPRWPGRCRWPTCPSTWCAPPSCSWPAAIAPRAQLLMDYAETRLLPRQLSGGRWAAIRKGLAGAGR